VVDLAHRENLRLTMPVQFKSGAVLLSGGQIALDPDCCCCDLVASTTYVAATLSVFAAAIGSVTYTFSVYKNGTLVHQLINTTGARSFSVPVVNGDVVSVTAIASAECSAGSTCTIRNAPMQPSCTKFNHVGLVGGQCLDYDELLARYVPFTPRTATISGLTGNMAPLNGVYSVSCASPTAGANLNWAGGGYLYNYGAVQVTWAAENQYLARVVCLQSNQDGFIMSGVISQPGDPTRRTGTVESGANPISTQIGLQYRRATCGDCEFAGNFYYETGGTAVGNSTSNGSPAESAIIAWS
jgi:hypothetical protein